MVIAQQVPRQPARRAVVGTVDTAVTIATYQIRTHIHLIVLLLEVVEAVAADPAVVLGRAGRDQAHLWFILQLRCAL